MNYLYFSPYNTDSLDGSVLLDDAFKVAKEDEECIIYFLYLDYFGDMINDFNLESSRIRNIEIAFDNKILVNKYKYKNIIPLPLSKFIKGRISKSYKIDSLDSVKGIKYKNLNIGLGVVSSFVSFTRNINPDMSNETCSFLTNFLNSTATITDALINFLSKYEIHSIKMFNGRYATIRPAYELAVENNLSFSTLEMLNLGDKDIRVYEYKQCLPHSILMRTKIADDLWTADDIKNKDKYKKFYIKRANGIEAGDKVYVSNQNINLLPKDWNSNNKNFVFFTSSEDEFYALGDEWDDLRLFKNQIEAAETLARICSEDYNIVLYIRIHPNLSSLPYNYAKFDSLSKYKNVRIIAADSNVSSYKMLFACDKVFTMGSTMGIEATYWDKPSILLNASLYYFMDTNYIPKSVNALRELVLAKDLKPKSKSGCYKYSKLVMTSNYGHVSEYINYNSSPVNFCKKRIDVAKSMTVFGSLKLYIMIKIIFRIINLPQKLYFKKKNWPLFLKEKK